MKLRSKLITTRLSIISCCFILLFTSNVKAQYEVNGDATKDDCNCYTLTEALNTQSGSVWNENKISLSNSFDYKFEVFLGNDDDGADGIAFVLQPISTSIGSTGGGMGYQGIAPAAGVTIDTYENSNSNDPSYDHIAIQLNGDIDHNSTNNIAGPISALASNPNIEDGQWHNFRITWDASTTEMKAYIDGSMRVSSTIDLVSTVFNGDPEVYWGLTASTGGERNVHRFCTKNESDFNIDPSLSYCLGDTVDFIDNSYSFGHIVNWYWDFGDGTADTTTAQGNVSHAYTSSGNYTVTLKVEGNDGCISDVKTISVDVNPNPDATAISNSPICENDSLTIEANGGGTYDWVGPDGFTSTQQNDTILNASLVNGGTYTLIVTNPYGCTDTTMVDVVVNPRPTVDVGPDYSICEGESVNLTATSNMNGVTFTWDNGLGNGANQTILPTTDTTYHVIGENSFGCTDESAVTVIVTPNPDVSLTANPIKGISPLEVNFTNTSSNSTQYNWDFGDGNNSTTNDIEVQHTFENDGVYSTTLIGYNQGCTDTAKVTIIVLFPKIEYKFPNIFTPNGDGENDHFHVIDPKYIKSFEVVVFNRWGNVVFESQKFNFQWNGKVDNSGSQCTEGTYFYKATLTDMNDETIQEHGFVDLKLGK